MSQELIDLQEAIDILEVTRRTISTTCYGWEKTYRAQKYLSAQFRSYFDEVAA